MASDTSKQNDEDTFSKIYQASSGRKIALIVVFIGLLPFFISLPFMIYLRASKGFTYDAIILAFIMVLFALWLTFLGIHILSSLRTKIRLNELDAEFILPNWRGPLPLLPYRKISMTYDDVQKVEQRGEIYREAILPVMMRSSCIITQDGSRHILGYSKEMATDPAFPFSEISHEIAMRAGLPLSDLGTVLAGGQYKAAIKGPPDWDKPPLSPEVVQTAHRASQKFWWITVAIGAAFIVVGILIKLWSIGVQGVAQ